MIAAMLGYLVSTLVVQYITRYWKISTHALGITAPLAALTLLYGRQPLPFMVLIPMVCWARVYLQGAHGHAGRGRRRARRSRRPRSSSRCSTSACSRRLLIGAR